MIKLYRQKQLSTNPLLVSMSLIISSNLTWTIHVHGQMLNPENCAATSDIPQDLTLESFKALISTLMKCNICAGHDDAKFIEMAEARGGKLQSQTNQVVSYLDSLCKPCIRHRECELLVKEVLCTVCKNYRSNLRAMYSSYIKKKGKLTHRKTNVRYLSPRQKRARLVTMKAALRNKQRQLDRVRKKLTELTEKHGVEVTDNLSGDFSGIIKDYDEEIKQLPIKDFKRVFWEQQVS